MARNKTAELTTTALMTALICIMGPLALPIGPVPVSLTNLAIYITLYAIGTKRGLVAYVIYLLLGIAGLPIFSGFMGGPQKIVGPTGGYLVGFILMILVAGWFIDKDYKNKVWCIAGMIIGTALAYLLGTLWLAWSAGMGIQAAVMAGVAPFVLEDLVKIVAASVVGAILRERLEKAGLR